MNTKLMCLGKVMVVGALGLGACTSSSDRPPKQTASAGGSDVGPTGGSGAAMTGSGAQGGDGGAPLGADSYALDLRNVTRRQRMQLWDPSWISEYEEAFGGYEWQVDPGNGGQIGVWTGSGNPTTSPSEARDYSQFIAAGPIAGMPTRVRMRYEHRDVGTWVSCAHANDGATRAHYEVALQNDELSIYKFWGPSPFSDYASVASTSFSAADGAVYWLQLTERRASNDPSGAATIEGELLDDQLRSLATIAVTDDGALAGQPLQPSSNKRGFGSFSQADGNGPRVFEWTVEPAP